MSHCSLCGGRGFLLRFDTEGVIECSCQAMRPADDIEPMQDFRSFYAARNPHYRGQYPCPIGTLDVEWHRAIADALADYADEIRKRLLP